MVANNPLGDCGSGTVPSRVVIGQSRILSPQMRNRRFSTGIQCPYAVSQESPLIGTPSIAGLSDINILSSFRVPFLFKTYCLVCVVILKATHAVHVMGEHQHYITCRW